MSNLTAHGDLFAFSCSISPVGDEWECKFRGVPITGYAPTAIDAACRRFSRVVDERKPARKSALPKFKYPTPEAAMKRIAEIKQRDAQWCWLMEVKAKVQEKKANRPHLIYCRGGDKTAPKVAAFAGLLSGSRNDYKSYAQVSMLDWDFSVEWTLKRWNKYLAEIAKHQPLIALIPDYFSDTPQSVMLQQVAEVKEAGACHVAVCPKFVGAVADIPLDCIIAVSVPTEYAGFLPAASELVGRRLHLLGGHPDQHLYLMRVRYPQNEIFSIDANVSAMQAGYGKWWSAKRADWIQTPISRQYKNVTLAMISARNWVRYLNDPQSKFRINERVSKCVERQADFEQLSLAI